MSGGFLVVCLCFLMVSGGFLNVFCGSGGILVVSWWCSNGSLVVSWCFSSGVLMVLWWFSSFSFLMVSGGFLMFF